MKATACSRLLHEGACDADIHGIVDPLPCSLDELEALSYQGSRDEG
jgi:hypothetical protein